MRNCPVCSGNGNIECIVSTSVGGAEWMRAGSKLDKIRGNLSQRVIETPQSKKRRAAWMETGMGVYKGPCPCTYWRRDGRLVPKLMRLEHQINKVEHPKPIGELNDSLDDI
jgi:hypothetical protein